MLRKGVERLSYVCKLCGKAFETKQALGGHVRKAHPGSTISDRRASKELPRDAKTDNPQSPSVSPLPATPSIHNSPSIMPVPPNPQPMPMLPFQNPNPNPQDQQQEFGMMLLSFLSSLFSSGKKSKIEEALMERAMEGLIEDIKLAQKVKHIMLETPARHLAKGVGKYLEKRVVEGEEESEEESLYDIVKRGFLNALKELTKRSEAGEGEAEKFD
jgi:hypothetical protein